MKDVWNEITEIISQSNKNIAVYSGDNDYGRRECAELSIPVESTLYSVVVNSSGLVIDNWIRIWGQDGTGNLGVFHYNSKYKKHILGLFLVAGDAVGGLFAINISRFSEDVNAVWYFAPDALEWESLKMQYNEFLAWSILGSTDEFYSTMRWSKWREEVAKVDANNAILIYPFLWAKECVIENASKKVVAVDELIELNFDFQDRFGNIK